MSEIETLYLLMCKINEAKMRARWAILTYYGQYGSESILARVLKAAPPLIKEGGIRCRITNARKICSYYNEVIDQVGAGTFEVSNER